MRRSLVQLVAILVGPSAGASLGACGPEPAPIVDAHPDGGGNVDPEFRSCAKLDIVIAVDNSTSMNEEKGALAGDVFPAMANQLLAIADGLDDYRVAVLDACPDPANYHTAGLSGPCDFASGQVWMESSDPDLPGEFRCVGAIDSTDSHCAGGTENEQPVTAATVSAEEPWRSGANAGFLRDDALLVVLAITDEDEQPVPDVSSRAVYDRLVAVKGDVRKIVFLGIAGGSNCTGVYGTAQNALKMRAIANWFIAENRGVFWDLCTGRLEDGLAEALIVITQACEEFPPIP